MLPIGAADEGDGGMGDGRGTTVAELWRYPVKSMRGERIDSGAVAEAGFIGDRGYALVDPATGKVGSAKHPRLWGALLDCEARYVETPRAGAQLPPVLMTLPNGDGVRSDDPEVDARLSAVFGRSVQLTTVAPEGNRYLAVWPEIDGAIPNEVLEQIAIEGSEAEGTLTELGLGMAAPPGSFFDVAALHVLTTTTLRHLGELQPGSRFTVERYRPNIVVDGNDEPFAENGWSGAGLRFGDALAASVLMPTMRCIMTTLGQGDLPRDNEVLRAVTRHNRIEIPGLGTWSCVGTYATVTTPGRVQVGDDVVVEPAA